MYLHFTREKTRQRAHLILKPWKRGGLEDFSRTKEDEMTTATFDHQVGKSLEFFEQQPPLARSPGNQPGSATGIQEPILSGTNAQARRMTNGSHFTKCGHDAGLRSSSSPR